MADDSPVDATQRVLSTMALSVALEDANKNLRQAVVLANGLTTSTSPARAALANALQALRAARTLLRDELKDDLRSE